MLIIMYGFWDENSKTMSKRNYLATDTTSFCGDAFCVEDNERLNIPGVRRNPALIKLYRIQFLEGERERAIFIATALKPTTGDCAC